jgi:hypothetical protein
MTKPEASASASKAVEELVASVKSNVEVVRDAMKSPATADSHIIVSDLMLDLKQSQEKLQKKASEMAESGRFENTNNIFEAIDQVTQLEPEFEGWSRSVIQNDDGGIGANIHVPNGGDTTDEGEKTKKKKKKKKSKKESLEEEQPIQMDGGWEAFPPAPGFQSLQGPPSGNQSMVTGKGMWPTSSTAVQPVAGSPSLRPTAASAKLTLGMTWDVVGPLLGDPGSTDEARKERLAELLKEAIATECNISLNRIRIRNIS